MILSRAIIRTPLGDMLALSSDAGLCALEFTGPMSGTRRSKGLRLRSGQGRSSERLGRLTRLDQRITRWFPPHHIVDQDSPTIVRTREWLCRYFDGRTAELDGLPLDMRGAPFERRVWRALLDIAPGETTSYGAIAKSLGSASASRAVGLANGANPIAIIVPCHRVIGSNGSLTGYGGGLDRKTWLIDHERRWRRDSLF